MGKLNFRGYLISRFYSTREIRENLMQAKNVFLQYLRWSVVFVEIEVDMLLTDGAMSRCPEIPTGVIDMYQAVRLSGRVS